MGPREILLATCVACTASPPHPLENHAPHRAHRAHHTLDEARAAATGRHRRRDYVEAAAIAGDLCESGCGDLAACRYYVRLVRHLRGVRDLKADDIARIVTRLCVRGLDIACVTATNVVEPGGLVEPLFMRCLVGDDLACDQAIDASDSDRVHPSTPMIMRTFAKICASGDADGCFGKDAFPPLAMCDAGDDEACHTAGVTSDKEYARRVDAIGAAYGDFVTTRAACRTGAKDACTRVATQTTCP